MLIIFIVLILSIFKGMIFILLIPGIIRGVRMGILGIMGVSWGFSRLLLRMLRETVFSIGRLVMSMIHILNKTTKTRKTT